MTRHIAPAILLIALLGPLALVCGCGGNGLSLISKDQEISMGREAGDKFEAENGGALSGQHAALVKAIGARIAKAASPPDYPYDFRALDNKAVNAVAFPGGRIYVYRGLIEAFSSDADKIAWVVGHEAAHVARRHAAKRVERSIGYEAIIAIIFGQKDAAKYAGIVAGLMLQDYGRDNEYEADIYGVRYAHDAGYDPTAAIPVLEKFKELQGRDPSNFELLFSSHPGNTDREDAVKAELAKWGWSGRYWKP